MDVVRSKHVFDHKKLKALRKQHGLSQGQLHKLSGLALNTVIKLEYGQIRRPGYDSIVRIAKVFGVDPEELLVEVGTDAEAGDEGEGHGPGQGDQGPTPPPPPTAEELLRLQQNYIQLSPRQRHTLQIMISRMLAESREGKQP